MQLRTTLLKIAAAPVIAIALFHCGAYSLAAQTPEGKPRRSVQPPDDNTPRELIYSYYCLKDGYDSTLYLMDNAPRTIEFTVAVHSLSGQTVFSQPRTIGPRDDLEINVKELLNELNVDYRGDFLEGSLSIHFKGTGNPLAGRMIIQGPQGRLNMGPVWRMGEHGQDMVPERLDTMWWDLGGARDAEITVNNASGEAAVADLLLDFQGKRHTVARLRFAPYETKHISVTQMLAGINVTAYEAPIGGLTVLPRSPKAALVAQGKITDPDTGGMAAMSFPLPQLQRANALHATGVPIGIPSADSPFAGIIDSNFIPHIYIRNLLDSEQTVTLTVEYPGQDGPVTTPLPPLTLRGYTTQDIRLDSYYSYLPLPLPFCSIRIQHNGPPGSLMAEVTSLNESSGKVNQIVVANEGNGYAGSLVSYWSFDEKTDFIVFLTNMGDKPCQMAFRIDAGGVDYYFQAPVLRARETLYINLRDMRDKQEPDPMGHTMPPDVTEGRLFYNRLDNVPMMGRVVVVPRKK